MKLRTTRLRPGVRTALLLILAASTGGASLAAAPANPGRLFYTPAERAQLETARAHSAPRDRQAGAELSPPAVRFDGLVIRSDGARTNWVNGRPQAGDAGAEGLKPGQIRADGKVYEPYQVLRPAPDLPREAAP